VFRGHRKLRKEREKKKKGQFVQIKVKKSYRKSKENYGKIGPMKSR
jgi:hypothetical protein